jgi:hypothetical protein
MEWNQLALGFRGIQTKFQTREPKSGAGQKLERGKNYRGEKFQLPREARQKHALGKTRLTTRGTTHYFITLNKHASWVPPVHAANHDAALRSAAAYSSGNAFLVTRKKPPKRSRRVACCRVGLILLEPRSSPACRRRVSGPISGDLLCSTIRCTLKSVLVFLSIFCFDLLLEVLTSLVAVQIWSNACMMHVLNYSLEPAA